MSTVTNFPHRDNCARHQLWDRFERADQFAHYLALHAQGISQRQAAKRLQVPICTMTLHTYDTPRACGRA